MRAGHKLGYAAAVAGGLLLAAAWAVAAQGVCAPVYDSLGLSFANCVNPDRAIASRSVAENTCNNMYTQGFWSQTTEAAGAHEIREAAAIRDGLSDDDWSTSGVVGGIVWEFDAATETVPTPWGYEDPKTIGQSIATLDTVIIELGNVIAIQGGSPTLVPRLLQSMDARDVLAQIQAGGSVRVPYYEDLPDWVDKPGAAPPSFDPNVPTYIAILDPLPEYLGNDVGHFTPSPEWDPTLTPGLEILKCEGRSATDIVASPTKFDDGGISCPPPTGTWSSAGRDDATGECIYKKRKWKPPYTQPDGVSYPGYWSIRYSREDWTCLPRPQKIEIGNDEIRRTLSGYRAQNGATYSCEYTFPRSVLNNYSLQLDEIDADPSLSPTTVGHDITDTTFFRKQSTPTGWGVRWVEHTRPRWPLGCDGFKPCWPTFDPDVRMSPRLDQLLVGTPVWVWMNNVSGSCLPTASPTPPGSDCTPDPTLPSLWQAWPADETDPDIWRHARRNIEAGNIWRAAFPQKISIELVHSRSGATSTYECWTDDNGGLRSVADGEWAPGQRPTLDAGSMPLATPSGPLNPAAGDCTFVHTTAGPYTATITIHWIGKVAHASPRGALVWKNPDPSEGDLPPAPTVQTVPVAFHELHTIPGP